MHPAVMAVFLTVLVATAAWGEGVTSEEGTQFFQRYVALGAGYDKALAELYADDARITTRRRYPTGRERALEMKGAEWRELVRRGMPLAKALGDRSEFTNMRIEQAGPLVRVRAERYSVRKCYWDHGYNMAIGRQPDGSLKIVEEHSESHADSKC